MVYRFSYQKMRERLDASGIKWRDIPLDYRMELRDSDGCHGRIDKFFTHHKVVRLFNGLVVVPLDDCEPVTPDNCGGDCDHCNWRYAVPGTDERIDREPAYYCRLLSED